MLKKIKKSVYDKKIDEKLNQFNSFDAFDYINGIPYPIFTSKNGNESGEKVFAPETSYAIKKAIEKLSGAYVTSVPTVVFKSKLLAYFNYFNMDSNDIKECVREYIKRRSQYTYSKTTKTI